MLAATVHAMSATWQAVFFTAAVILFILSALQGQFVKPKVAINLGALGLACYTFVWAWNAWAAT